MWENQRFKAGKYAFDMNAYYTDEKNELIVGAGVQLHTAESTTIDGRYGLRMSTNEGDSMQFIAKSSQFVFLQYIRKINNFELIAGSRYEMTIFGNAFAPRFGLIYHKNKFHGKLLYGRSFRVPLFWQAFSEQYFTGVPLKPEISNTLESEIGYKFSQNLTALLNIFWTEIKQPITYIGANNSYQNFGEIVSMGAESEIHYRHKSQNLWLNLSFFMPGKKTSDGFLSEEKTAFLAVPALKLNAAYGLEMKRFTAGVNATYMGKKFAQTQFSALNSIDSLIRQTSSTPAVILFNINFSFKKILKKTDIFLTVKNILNTRYWLMQPYYGAHAPMPASERQINLTLKVNF
jgi:outer membrane receptor protein involved in Fe transport